MRVAAQGPAFNTGEQGVASRASRRTALSGAQRALLLMLADPELRTSTPLKQPMPRRQLTLPPCPGTPETRCLLQNCVPCSVPPPAHPPAAEGAQIDAPSMHARPQPASEPAALWDRRSALDLAAASFSEPIARTLADRISGSHLRIVAKALVSPRLATRTQDSSASWRSWRRKIYREMLARA